MAKNRRSDQTVHEGPDSSKGRRGASQLRHASYYRIKSTASIDARLSNVVATTNDQSNSFAPGGGTGPQGSWDPNVPYGRFNSGATMGGDWPDVNMSAAGTYHFSGYKPPTVPDRASGIDVSDEVNNREKETGMNKTRNPAQSPIPSPAPSVSAGSLSKMITKYNLPQSNEVLSCSSRHVCTNRVLIDL